MAEVLSGENLWFLLDFVEGVIFLVCAVLFRVRPERAGFLISHYNTFSREKKARYDMAGLGRYVSGIFLLCALVCLVGAAATIRFAELAYWASTILWIAIALATLRVDREALLKKYGEGRA